MSTQTVYIDSTTVAKIIRTDLAKAFPGQKFSVKTKKYAGGSSVDTYWLDGPTNSEVDALIGRYEAKGFDGSIDLGYYKQHYQMPDGSIVYGGSGGTAGSGGYVSADRVALPEGAKPVSLMSDYIGTNRDLSPAVLQAAADALGIQVEIKAYSDGSAYIANNGNIDDDLEVKRLARQTSYYNRQTSYCKQA